MSEAQEGQMVECGMSADEMAALSEPRETEGEVPDSKKEFGTIGFEDVEASCKSADEQADDRDEVPMEASEEE